MKHKTCSIQDHSMYVIDHSYEGLSGEISRTHRYRRFCLHSFVHFKKVNKKVSNIKLHVCVVIGHATISNCFDASRSNMVEL